MDELNYDREALKDEHEALYNSLNRDKKAVYLAEHRRLVERYALELHLSRFEVNVSVAIRHLMSFMGGIYLKLFVR